MTPLFMESGADLWIQNQAAQHGKWASMSWSGPGMLMGYAAPVAVPASLWLSDDPVHVRGGAAAAQSALVAFTSNLTLKSITNRRPPKSGVQSEADDVHGFQYGWWRQVPFHGWPSAHVMTNTAMVAPSPPITALHGWSQVRSRGQATWLPPYPSDFLAAFIGPPTLPRA